MRACYRLVIWSEAGSRRGSWGRLRRTPRPTGIPAGWPESAATLRGRVGREGCESCSLRDDRRELASARLVRRRPPLVFKGVRILGGRVSRPVPVGTGNCAHFRLATGGGSFLFVTFLWGRMFFSRKHRLAFLGIWLAIRYSIFCSLIVRFGREGRGGGGRRQAGPRVARPQMCAKKLSIQPAHIWINSTRTGFGRTDPVASRKPQEILKLPSVANGSAAEIPDFNAWSIQPAHIQFNPHTLNSTRTHTIQPAHTQFNPHTYTSH